MELYLQGILIALKGAPATIGVSLFCRSHWSGCGSWICADEAVPQQTGKGNSKDIHRDSEGNSDDSSGPHNGFRNPVSAAAERNTV